MTDQYSCSRRRLLGLTTRAALLLPAVFGVSPAAWADEFFSPPKIGDFTGSAWGKLTFGQTTQEGIKRDWKNGRGDFRNSVELKTQGDLPYKISALFPTVQKTATLDGIVIRWRDDNQGGLPIAELRTALDNGADSVVFRHPTVRYEDWYVALWQQKGIAALVLNGRVAWIMLGAPPKIAWVFSQFVSQGAVISPVPDPGAGKVKEVVYGSVQVRFDLKNIELDHKTREQDDIEDDLRRAGDGRNREPLRYDRGAFGCYEITVTAHALDNKDTNGTVTARLSGVTPYGQVDVSADETFRLEKNKRCLEDTHFDRAVGAAARAVEAKAGNALRAQGPFTPEAWRRSHWNQIIEDYRTFTPGKSGGLL